MIMCTPMLKACFAMTRSICIITARGGSKRIPRKNIKEFCGKPIIAYSIEAALESGLFEDVVVSTDDNEIVEIAKHYGASVPFMRSEVNSGDYADTEDVLLEVLDSLSKQRKNYDCFCCIYPTAPFITAKKLRDSFDILNKDDVYSVVPVTQFSFPPQRGLMMENGFVAPVDEESLDLRSQDLKPIYHDCGQFYWCKTKEFVKSRAIISASTAAYIVPEIEVQDIDNFTDWSLAELKYEYLRRENEI